MMEAERIIFDAAVGDGNKIAAFISPSAVDPAELKGVFQICHGMSDHYGRYDEMIEYLNEAGWHVCGMDMLGHGQTYGLNEDNEMPKGYFGDEADSELCILRDEMELHRIVKDRYGRDLSYVLYGHSMGSFVVRNIYITPDYAKEFDRFIFSSTMGPNMAVGFGIFLARLCCLMGLKKKPGRLVNKIAFSQYNKQIEDAKTDYDWLTRDDSEVQKFIADEMCVFTFTYKGFMDLFKLVRRQQSAKAYRKLPNKPVFLVYGDDDPVGDYGEGVRKVIDRLEEAGAQVNSKDYGHFRHELHHESVRRELFDDIVKFAEGHFE